MLHAFSEGHFLQDDCRAATVASRQAARATRLLASSATNPLTVGYLEQAFLG
jgi:hypothetical protein